MTAPLSSHPLRPGSPEAAKDRGQDDFRRDVVAGLRSAPKRISSKYFYDSAGSALFDAICELPEYYVTRTELAILEANVSTIAARIARGRACRVVEPGAGSGTKTRLLLRALGEEGCVEYVPVDIAGEHLGRAASRHRAALPWLRVTPFAADFTVDLPLPRTEAAAHTVVYFPGSTLGNFDPSESRTLLARFRHTAGPDGFVLLGIDLKKDPAELHAAYNDARGITAAFNKNLLRRINAELDADIDVDAFHHYAFYAPAAGRVEMHLVSARRQELHVGPDVVTVEDGESICTEHSYKYELSSFERLARGAGLALVDCWTDARRRFAILLLRCV